MIRRMSSCTFKIALHQETRLAMFNTPPLSRDMALHRVSAAQAAFDQALCKGSMEDSKVILDMVSIPGHQRPALNQAGKIMREYANCSKGRTNPPESFSFTQKSSLDLLTMMTVKLNIQRMVTCTWLDASKKWVFHAFPMVNSIWRNMREIFLTDIACIYCQWTEFCPLVA